MEEITNILLDAGLEIISILVGALVIWIGSEVKGWLRTKGNAEQLKLKEQYAVLAVQAVELAFQNLASSDKYEVAKQKLLDWANNNNIPLEDREIDTLIESSVKQLKEQGREIKEVYKQELNPK